MPAPGSRSARRDALNAFLGRPTLGGWLAILNGGACLAIVAWFESPFHVDPPAVVFFTLVGILLVLSFPLNLVPWLTRATFDSNEQVFVLGGLLIVLNAILWGYALAAILRRCFPSRFGRTAAPADPPAVAPVSPGRAGDRGPVR